MHTKSVPAALLWAAAMWAMISPAHADAQASSTFPPAAIVTDEGGPDLVQGEWTYTSAIVTEHYVEPVAALMNVSRYVVGDYSSWVKVDEQILGRLTSARTTPPVNYAIRVPIRVDGARVDVDNDGGADAGVQIYALFIGSNLTGDSYLEQLEQTAYRSYLVDPATGAIREGTFLLNAPDDAQGFPSGAGEDGVYFTSDDPVVGLPAGYTLAILGRDGRVRFDRSRVATMHTREEASTASPDFSAEGILASYNALIDLLKVRYSYTDLRGIDWEEIRASFLPRVREADAAGDVAAYYIALTELGRSIRDAHVYTRVVDAAVKSVYWRAIDQEFAADLGALGAELTDGRYVITYVAPEGPAANAGWEVGTEILRLDGEPIAQRIDRLPLLSSVGTPEAARLWQLKIALSFPDGKAVRVDYRQPGEDAVRTATLTASTGLQYPETTASSEPLSYKELEGGYGYVTWNLFRDPQYTLAIWERFLGLFRGAPGIVIDLRGNGGGNAELMYTMASYFFSEEHPASYHWIDNWYFDDAAGGHVKAFALDVPLYAPKPELRYDGALVVLVDQNSTSAGEYFPQFLQYHQRARVVGEHPSEGAGGVVEQVAMPGNMTFHFTKGRTYFAGTDDVNLETKGVTLDVRVPITEENERAKLEGRDPILEAAIEVLADEGVKISRGQLARNSWRLQRIFAAPGAPPQTGVPEDYTITFADDGSLDVKTDCHVSKADYEVGAGGLLKITPSSSTLAACPETSLGATFVNWLAAARTFRMDGDGLAVLTDADSGVIALMFAPLP